jgi:hypothetical protein
LRRSLVPLDHHPFGHDARLEVATDESQEALVLDPFCQLPHENVVVHTVEELLEVHVYDPPAPFLDGFLRRAYRIVRPASRPEAIAVFREAGIESRLQDLQDRLLDEPIERAGDAELSHPSPALRYELTLHRLRLVVPREHLRPQFLPVLHQVCRQFLHGHPVCSGTALVLSYTFQRRLHVRALDHLLHEAVGS